MYFEIKPLVTRIMFVCICNLSDKYKLLLNCLFGESKHQFLHFCIFEDDWTFLWLNRIGYLEYKVVGHKKKVPGPMHNYLFQLNL